VRPTGRGGGSRGRRVHCAALHDQGQRRLALWPLFGGDAGRRVRSLSRAGPALAAV